MAHTVHTSSSAHDKVQACPRLAPRPHTDCRTLPVQGSQSDEDQYSISADEETSPDDLKVESDAESDVMCGTSGQQAQSGSLGSRTAALDHRLPAPAEWAAAKQQQQQQQGLAAPADTGCSAFGGQTASGTATSGLLMLCQYSTGPLRSAGLCS